MYSVQMASTTPCSLKAMSLKQLLVLGYLEERTFQGQGWGRSLRLPGSSSWVSWRPCPFNDLLQQQHGGSGFCGRFHCIIIP